MSFTQAAKALLARSLVGAISMTMVLVDGLSRLFGVKRSVEADLRRVMIIGTFYNPGWFVAHVLPLVQTSKIDEVLVVCDEPVSVDFDGVQFFCPSPDQHKRYGRGISRLLTVFSAARRWRPDIYMGYHIMPNAPLALLMSRLFGGRAIYQMTGGPIQIEGGGYQSENPLLKAMAVPSRLLERVVFAMVRRFDAVVVRGSSAQEFVEMHQLSENCFVVTGAIDMERFAPMSKKDIDLLYVGRLVEDKGVEDVIKVVAELSKSSPGIRASIVGDGELRPFLESMSNELGVTGNITFHGRRADVHEFLGRSKVFILLSPSEGMSIAMLEAMAAGVPVVVRNVGDLSDVLRGRDGGALIDDFEIVSSAGVVAALLSDDLRWRASSAAARSTIEELSSISAMASRWEGELDRWRL